MFLGILPLVDVMADRKLHSLSPKKMYFAAIVWPIKQARVLPHAVELSFRKTDIFLDSLKSIHSATGCNSQRDLVCIGAIPLKNFSSRDYENEKARPSAGVSQKSGATKLEHSWCWQWTFLELFVKRTTTQTHELSLKAGAFARRVEICSQNRTWLTSFPEILSFPDSSYPCSYHNLMKW